MEEMRRQLLDLISASYSTQSECSKALGWPRQRLNKLICGTKEPDISELFALANAPHTSVGVVADIFLLLWSPNGQQSA